MLRCGTDMSLKVSLKLFKRGEEQKSEHSEKLTASVSIQVGKFCFFFVNEDITEKGAKCEMHHEHFTLNKLEHLKPHGR